jgi:hypothetical protein
MIAWQWEDCGQGPFNKRVGFSESLGPKQRSVGVPKGLEHLVYPSTKIDPFDARPHHHGPIRPAERKRVLRPFRSKYEDGIRDVRSLYPDYFYGHMTKLRHEVQASSRSPLYTKGDEDMPDEEWS